MSCKINIDNPTGKFYPGNAIRGRVVCIFNSRQEIREIKLKCIGREVTSWKKSESYYDRPSNSTKYRTVQYTGDRKFLMNQLTLTGAGHMATPGRFESPFEFVLPSKCPSSFNTTNGCVVYCLEATVLVDVPWAPNYTRRVIFKVVSPIDFNRIPNLVMSPTQYQDEKFICCCCCTSGPITLDVYLEKEAYVLGETIKIKAHLSNMSNENILALRAKLIMTIKETTTSPKHDTVYTEDLLAGVNETGVGAHSEREYDLCLVVPETTMLSNFALCTLFEQWFTLKIHADLPGYHADMEVEKRIRLGHIPLGAPVIAQNRSRPPPPPPGNIPLRGPGITQTVIVQNRPRPPPPPPGNVPLRGPEIAQTVIAQNRPLPPPPPPVDLSPPPYPAGSAASESPPPTYYEAIRNNPFLHSSGPPR